MLNRQKTMLYLLDLAGGESTALHLVKWAFLIREESVSKGGASFYEFVPHKYGPYSFCVAQEMNALAEQGYLEVIERDGRTSWKVTALGKTAGKGTPALVAKDARQIHWHYGKLTTDALIENIYPRYSWFTINSQIKKLDKKPNVKPAVFTAGYEGVTVDGFLNSLLRAGIQRIIDVRNNPVSRRYGFHKSTLNRLAGFVGIEYMHVPELGIHSENRQELESQADYDALFDVYRAKTLKREIDAIKRVSKLVEEKPSVLVCMEANPCQCHRSHLAAAVADESTLAIKHLRA